MNSLSYTQLSRKIDPKNFPDEQTEPDDGWRGYESEAQPARQGMTHQMRLWIWDAIVDERGIEDAADDCVAAGATIHEVNEWLITLDEEPAFVE